MLILQVQHPSADAVLKIGQTFSVAGIVTDRTQDTPFIETVTVSVDGQPPVRAHLTRLPNQPVPTALFQVDLPVPPTLGPHSVVVTATDDGGATDTREQRVYCANDTPHLLRILLTLHTHDDNLDHDTVVHVFVKNRSPTSATPLGQTSFIGNLTAWQSHAAEGPFGINPYLGFAEDALRGLGLDDPSTHTIDVPLRAEPIPLSEVDLPVVDIHIVAHGNDRWVFNYTVEFTFDDGRVFSATSNADGVSGVILDQDHRDHSGLCTENPFLPPRIAPAAGKGPLLRRVVIDLSTHDSVRDGNSRINVHVVDRVGPDARRAIASADNVLPGVRFDDPSQHRIELDLASDTIYLGDIVLPLILIDMRPGGTDLWLPWILDYRVSFLFDGLEPFETTASGVFLHLVCPVHRGAYQGPPFSLPQAPQAVLTGPPILRNGKVIPLALVQAKLDAVINNRQGVGAQLPPLKRVRLHNAGVYGNALPISTLDLQSIAAARPAPGTIFPDGTSPGVVYDSSVSELGQLKGVLGIGDLYLNDINSNLLTVNIDPGQTTELPIAVRLEFETDGPNETVGGLGGMDIKRFTIDIRLTLRPDPDNGRIDLMGWVDDIESLHFVPFGGGSYVTGTFLGQRIDGAVPIGFKSSLIDRVVHVVVEAGTAEFGGTFQKKMRENLYDRLAKPDAITQTTGCDALNATVNSWLMGGVIDRGHTALLPFPWPSRLRHAAPQGDTLVLDYDGPAASFAFDQPADWPAGVDFAPGTLANIDHIVVLTKENRSFDHLLGYLSLPVEQGGMGRGDVDGLKGGESNLLDGTPCPSFAFARGETVFAGGPPNGFAQVARAINGGAMDGFVQSAAAEAGPLIGPRVMGFHTADNVPVYDALARDFAVGQRWFASHPGPTFPNRFHQLTGRLNIDNWGAWELDNPSPLRAVFTPTVFDQLTQRGVSWTCFEHTYCFLRFFEQHTFDDQHIVAFDDPVAGFEALAKAGRLPAVSFIDPHFVDLPPGSNCDEPPSDIRAGQALVQRVVEAVVGGARWDRTLLLITYDEHGGFFDHVPPPAAINAEQGLPPTCGLRVPTFVVSPWVAPGSVFGHDATAAGGSALHFDHTSILKTIARRFMATDPPYMGPRFAAANDLSAVIGPVLRSGQFLPFVAYHLRDDASRQRLTTVGSAVGAAPQLAAPDDGPAQRFSFEDAGEGWFYIRAQGSRLYLSVDASQNVTQQPRLRPPADPGSDAPADGQRWRLTPDPTLHGDPTRLTIRSAAFPTKSLQPAAGDTAQAVVVLGDPRAVAGQRIVNPWQVTLASEADDSAASATGPAISTLRDVFTTADSIAVMWAGLPGNPKDWLALATAGAAAKSVLDWTYVGGAVSGSTTFSGTRLNPGTYVARAMVDDGYTVVAESTAFTVTALAAGTVATDRASYAQGESIDIRWSGLTDHTTNWVAYAPAGSPATTVTRWAYAGGRAAGSLQFEGPPAAGTYVARTFADDTYVLTAESAAFVVR